MSKSKSKSSDRSSLYKDARTQPRRIEAVQTTKLKKAMRGQDSGKPECKEIFSKRRLTIREERAGLLPWDVGCDEIGFCSYCHHSKSRRG